MQPIAGTCANSVGRDDGPSSAARLLQPLRVAIWRNKDGVTFTLTAYTLAGCPAPLTGDYFLARVGADGAVRYVAAGQCRADAASLNLAEIRRRGAMLQATEVHLLARGAATVHAPDSDRAP